MFKKYKNKKKCSSYHCHVYVYFVCSTQRVLRPQQNAPTFSFYHYIYTHTDSVTFVSFVVGDRVWSELVLVSFAMGFVDGVWRVSCL